MRFPADRLYSPRHLWVKSVGDAATIGITEFAQYEMGEISLVAVSSRTVEIEKGGVFGKLEAVKMTMDLRMPISGRVTAVNPLLETNPALVNKDCYGKGWIIKVEAAEEETYKDLMHAVDYMGPW